MNLVYEEQWSTWEEWGGIKIFQDEAGNYFAQDDGYSVYGSEPYENELYPITEDRAIELIYEWDEHTKDRWEY